ncbi:hypothetical protein, partial [Salmonella enterica]|uniref:hypothetical protein n=1 Tax=Salmonella enterica TaxID=28901 RepID=UPI0032987883
VQAIVDDGRLSIDGRLVRHEPPAQGSPARLRPLAVGDALPLDLATELGNTGDLSAFGGRIYPNKPPGLSVLAAPGYAV